MTTRRQLLLLGIVSAVASEFVYAQTRVPRIGILSGLGMDKSVLAPLLIEALAELGYREGSGMTLDFRSIDRQPERYASVARELVNARCDVIFALGGVDAARAMRKATSSVPVVIIATLYDPVERGIVVNLSRPERNITGVYMPTTALVAKRFEFAQQVLPEVRKYLVLADVHSKDQLSAVREAAGRRGMQLTIADYSRPPYDLAASFDAGKLAGVEAVFILTSSGFAAQRRQLAELISRHRWPAFVPVFMSEDPGILLSYSVDLAKLTRRAANIGARILQGAKPAEIPVEQFDDYDLIVNLKTAKALGLKIPYSILITARRIIE